MIEQKKCSQCLLLKPHSSFYLYKKSKDGRRSSCVECCKNYKEQNKEKYKELTKKYNKKRKDQKKQWALDNKDKVNESKKKWTDSNKEKRKEYIKEYNKRYYQLNLEKRREYSKVKQKEYRQTNDLYRIKSNLRRRINRYIKKKSKSTEDILGINYIDFLIYIQSKFTDGMSIEKLGNEIHIDHIVPLSSAKSEEELYKLCRYTNLQPLWAKDNLSKSDKLFKLPLIYNQ